MYAISPVLNNIPSAVPVFTGQTPVFINVATNVVTPFIPYASGITDTLYVFAAGTTSPLIAKGLISSFTPTRSYTTVYSGSYRGNLAAKQLNTFVNY